MRIPKLKCNFTRKSIIRAVKTSLLGVATAASVSLAVFTAIPIAMADSSGILGTESALGSPILNNDATVDNWNKWEMVCWGVYLSNFCRPFIDSYSTAFQTGQENTFGSGSNGAGYNALAMGTGNDATNNKTIESFCNYAITQQESNYIKPLYVGFSKIEGGKYTEEVKDESPEDTRQATVQDLFFYMEGDSDFPSAYDGHTALKVGAKSDFSHYAKMLVAEKGSIPTFYVADPNNKMYKVFDYHDPWDIQIAASMLYAAYSNDDTKKAFCTNLEMAWQAAGEAQLGVDCFGNIVVYNDVVVIPAAANQHITTKPSINLINSFICNTFIATKSDSAIVEGLKADHANGLFADLADPLGFKVYGGTNPFGETKIGNIGLFYYDTDTVAIQEDKDGRDPEYNKLLKSVFDSEPFGEHNYTLKYSVAGYDSESKVFILPWDVTGSTAKYHVVNLLKASCVLSNLNTYGNTNQDILQYIEYPSGEQVPIFDTNTDTHVTHGVIVTPQLNIKSEDSDGTYVTYLKDFWNWMYKVYSGEINSHAVSKEAMQNIIATVKTPRQLQFVTMPSTYTFGDSKYSATSLWLAFYPTKKGTFQKFIYEPDYDSDRYPDIKVAGSIVTKQGKSDGGMAEHFINDGDSRIVKAFPVSEMYRSMASYLSLEDGTEFARLAPYAYMTYLDFYGVINKTTQSSGTDAESAFSPRLYDPTSDMMNKDPSEIYDAKSKDELENEIMGLVFLALDPETGQSYRNKMVFSNLENTIFESYNRAVYGGSSDSYSGTASKSNSGFFYIPPYSDNPATEWFISNYARIAVIMIAISIILLIVLGLLSGKKLTYYFFGVVTIVNVLLLVPSSGEIVPYIVATASERMFERKLTFWSLSEGIENASVESDQNNKVNGYANLSAEDAKKLNAILKQLSSSSTDRSLKLKQDISQKVTQKLGNLYENIQTVESARWLLPLVMQQYSADTSKDVNKYLYVSLANVWDDASNLYWYYYPEDAVNVTGGKATATSNQFVDGSAVTAKEDEKYGDDASTVFPTQFYPDYKTLKADLNIYDKSTSGINYNNHCYYKKNNDAKNLVHLYNYILPDGERSLVSRSTVFDSTYSTYTDADSWADYIEKSRTTLSQSAWLTTNDPADPEDSNYRQTGFENMADEYIRTDASTLKAGYGFYKSTESPFYYFFDVTKDQFESNWSLAGVLMRLQGTIQLVDKDFNPVDPDTLTVEEKEKKIKSGELQEVRSNFMYATITDSDEDYKIFEYRSNEALKEVEGIDAKYTPYVRDVLDLKQMFNNCIPYLYQMTLTTGGFDGKSGVLEDEKITSESDYYEGLNQSWAYRCNWAVKLMENPLYSRPAQVRTRDDSGNVTGTYTINNPMLPDNYETVAGRPMVFSEAQQKEYHLEDSDLSLVELKCVKVNKETARNWTLLLNYTSTSGLTKEVLFREMGLEATLAFNSEFSSGGITNNSYGLYPRTIDLRHLSFDAVMKMLMMGVSRDSSYIYNSSMSKLIQDSDMLSMVMLLADTYICVYVIPFLRAAIMAIIFYLGFISILRVLFAATPIKTKICVGQFMMYVGFAMYTLAYFLVISALMSVSSSDEVLSSASVQVKTGNPVWVLFVILIISIVYSLLMIAQIVFVVRNVSDMGYSAVVDTIGAISGKLSDGFTSLGGTIQSKVSGGGTTVVRNETVHNSSTTTVKGGGGTSRVVNAKTGDDMFYISHDEKAAESLDSLNSGNSSSSYSSGKSTVDSGELASIINEQIEKGSKLNKN